MTFRVNSRMSCWTAHRLIPLKTPLDSQSPHLRNEPLNSPAIHSAGRALTGGGLSRRDTIRIMAFDGMRKISGLTSEQVVERVSAGQVNVNADVHTRSVARIVRDNLACC